MCVHLYTTQQTAPTKNVKKQDLLMLVTTENLTYQDSNIISNRLIINQLFYSDIIFMTNLL
jgi:hypothetical protein